MPRPSSILARAFLVLTLGCGAPPDRGGEELGAVSQSSGGVASDGVAAPRVDEGFDEIVGEGVVLACGAATPVYSGPLCGSASAPCVALRSETLPGAAGFRNDSPAIAISPTGAPAVMLSLAEGGFHGFLATRDDVSGTWSSAPVPFPYATGAATFAPDGTLLVSTEDGAYGHHLRAFDGAAWSELDRIPTTQAVFAGALVRDDAGCIHTAHSPGTARGPGASPTLHLTRSPDGRWSAHHAGSGSAPNLGAAMALGSSGVAHLAWNERVDGEARPAWASSASSSVEWIAMPAGTPIEVAAVDVGGDERVHVLTGGGGVHHAVRRGGAWTTATLAADAEASDCGGPVEDATCRTHTVVHAPLAIVTSGRGDVRLLWSRTESRVMSTGRCTQPGPGGPMMERCDWQITSREDARTIVIADPSISPPTISTAVRGTGGITGTAAVDREGRIHLAVYEQVPGSGATVARYAMIGEPIGSPAPVAPVRALRALPYATLASEHSCRDQ